jgi:hypothetical protein
MRNRSVSISPGILLLDLIRRGRVSNTPPPRSVDYQRDFLEADMVWI